MSLKDWWQGLLKKGFFFKIKKDWPGDEKLNYPPVWPKTVTKRDVENEIRESLKKEKKNGIR